MDRIARLRTQVRELRASELAVLNARSVQLERELLQTLRVREGALEEEAQTAAAGRFGEEALHLSRTWIRGLSDTEDRLREERAALEETIAAKRGEVILARQEEEKLLRLEERDRLAAVASSQREVDLALDEFAQQAHRREDQRDSQDGG